MIRLGEHVLKVGDLVRSRRVEFGTKGEWMYGSVRKIEGGIVTVAFRPEAGKEPRVAEWIGSEMPWRHDHGMLEAKRPTPTERSA